MAKLSRRKFLTLASQSSLVGVPACKALSRALTPPARASLGSVPALQLTGAGAAPALHTSSRTIKLGFVTPQSGYLSEFSQVDSFVIREFIYTYKKGLVVGNRHYTIEVIARDSESDPDVAKSAANALIRDDQIDLMLVGHMSETSNPVASVCEAAKMPCVSTLAPWQPWFIRRQNSPGDPTSWVQFDFTYHFQWGLQEVSAVYLNMWNQLGNNNAVGGLFPDDDDGIAFGDPLIGFPAAVRAANFKLTDPGRYQASTNFSTEIAAFKENSCEIVTGLLSAENVGKFLKQASAANYKPTIVTVGKGTMFPSTLNSVGQIAQNISTEVWWSDQHPYRSSISGISAGEYCAAFEQSEATQWTQPLGFVHALFEVAVDVFKRVEDSRNRREVAAAIALTNLDTIVGKLHWSGAGLPPFASKNICKTPLVGGQWRRSGDGKYRLVIVDNQLAPEIPLAGQMETMG